MLPVFQNPLLRFMVRMWWVPALTVITTGLFIFEDNGIEIFLTIFTIIGWMLVGLVGAAQLNALLGWFTGKMNREKAAHRFLCPYCLRFGDFSYACKSCQQKIPSFIPHTGGAYVNRCPECQASLLSGEAENVMAFCGACYRVCDPDIHHHRQVRVVGVLTTGDFEKLRAASGAVEKRVPGLLNYAVSDDGARLTYILDLESLKGGMDDPMSALAHMEAIWTDAASIDALRLGEVVDGFLVRSWMSDARARRLEVWVPQWQIELTREHILKTRFGPLRLHVTASSFISKSEESIPNTIASGPTGNEDMERAASTAGARKLKENL